LWGCNLDTAQSARRVLKAILDAYPAGAIVVFDTDARFTFVGGEGLAPVDLQPDAMIGRTPVEVFSEPLGAHVMAQYQRCLHGERFTEEVSFAGRIYDVTHRPVFGPQGQVEAGVVITVDVTRERTEKAQRDLAEARYRALVRDFPGATFLFDEDNRYLAAGGQALAAQGFDPDRLEGHTPREVLGPAVGESVEGMIDEAREQGTAVHEVASSGERIFELRFVRVEGTRHVVSMALDVTEARTAHRRAQDDLARQEALLREVHHRVKNHLQIVQSLLGMTARRVRSQAARRSLLDVRSRVRAMSVVHAELYRDPENASLRLDAFLESLLAQLRLSLPSLGRVRCTTQLDPLQGSNDIALHLGLVLTELVTNSAKHAFADRDQGALEIRLCLEDDDTFVLLEVRDDGPGLPDDAEDGTGSLGLWLVRTLTEPRGGSLTTDPECAGACWVVRLPNDSGAVGPAEA